MTPLTDALKRARTAFLLSFVLAFIGCGGAVPEPKWPPRAEEWYQRALASYETADLEDATAAVAHALELTPARPDARLLAAKIALARLNYDEAIRYTRGDTSATALALQGRALWYSGKVEEAAEVLEELLRDPSVHDPWARAIAKLARRGRGRVPFRTSGSMIAAVDMPAAGSAMVVPVEVNGELALGVVATSSPECVVDSKEGDAASWISLRFGDRLEVKDVPALGQDLSGVSRTFGAPIKVLLGMNLLRRLNATIDVTGQQFVVRTFEPPPPPGATALAAAYIKGGGMVLRLGLTGSATLLSPLLVDTLIAPPLSLDESGWKAAGVPLAQLAPVGPDGKLRVGTLPVVKLGAFDLPQVAGVYPVAMPPGLDMHLVGIIGAGLLAPFRVTLFDHGRGLWVEQLLGSFVPESDPGRGQPAEPGPPQDGPALP